MSVKVQALVWDYYPAGGDELLVALKVADHADHDGGRIYPSVSSLARQTRQSDRSVQRHLKSMRSRKWLMVVSQGGHGAGSTTQYRIPVECIPHQVEVRVTDCHPGKARVTDATNKGDKTGRKGDTALSPESSLEPPVKNRQGIAKGAGAPSAVTQLFETYCKGIERRYGAKFPPSAKANGQLSSVLARLGVDNARAVIAFYLNSQNPFYGRVRHSLNVLVKDCERLYVDLQVAAGNPHARPPTKAEVWLLDRDGKPVRQLKDYPLGEPAEIAAQAAGDYSRMIGALQPKKIMVQMGSARRIYDLEELRAPA